MFKNIDLKHLSDESYIGLFFIYMYTQYFKLKATSQWIQNYYILLSKTKFIIVQMKCTYWYLKCIIKKTLWCCVFLVYQYLSHWCWHCLVFCFDSEGIKVLKCWQMESNVSMCGYKLLIECASTPVSQLGHQVYTLGCLRFYKIKTIKME